MILFSSCVRLRYFVIAFTIKAVWRTPITPNMATMSLESQNFVDFVKRCEMYWWTLIFKNHSCGVKSPKPRFGSVTEIIHTQSK